MSQEPHLQEDQSTSETPAPVERRAAAALPLRSWPQGGRPKALNPIYSAKVGRLKKVLLGGAGALMAVLLLWPNVHVTEDPFLMTQEAFPKPPPGMKTLAKASLHATTRQGHPYVVSSLSVCQKTADQFIFDHPTAILQGAQPISLTAVQGEARKKEHLLDLQQQVCIQNTAGYELQTARAQVDLQAGEAQGQEPVHGKGPLGQIEAGGFETRDQGRVVIFTKGAHLSFTPPGEKTPPAAAVSTSIP